MRGERGSTAENLTSLKYKIQQDSKRLEDIQDQIAKETVCRNSNHEAFMTFSEIDQSGKKSFSGKYSVSAKDYEKLTTLAKNSYSAETDAKKLREENRRLQGQIWSLQSKVSRLEKALEELTERCRPYLEALKAAPKKVRDFLDEIISKFKQQEKSIFYEPKLQQENPSRQREKRFRNTKSER